jgi:hypothetical protein
MSEISADSGLEYLIPVRYDATDHSLTILHPNLSLRPGDRAIWAFEGVPADWTPWIQFKPGDPQAGFLGPFASLAQIEGGISGHCRADLAELPATYTYRICIQKGVGLDWQATTAAICSQQATILVHEREQKRQQSLTFTVRSAGEGKLVVEPLGLPLQSGDTVEWIFDVPGDPALWRPRINFGRYTGTGTVPNQLLGPFTCLVYETGKVTGLGNSGVQGTYFFEVSLISLATGAVEWIGSDDPAIDNMGPIWDPVSGGPAR